LKSDETDPAKQIPYLEDRQTLGHWGAKQIEAGKMDDYRAKNNTRSLNGLPGLRRARLDAGERLWIGNLKARITPEAGITFTAVVALLSAMLTCISLYILGLVQLS
jgi:hypothetical protein